MQMLMNERTVGQCVFLSSFFFLSYNSPSSAFIYLFSHRAYGILVPRPGIKPVPFSVEAESLNSWAAREVPVSELFYQEGLFCWPRLER